MQTLYIMKMDDVIKMEFSRKSCTKLAVADVAF